MNNHALAVQPPAAATSLSKTTRFACTAPGCHRSFTRKEHLTRHSKSHSTQLQYQCPICGRKYARSDVFKRHVEFHPKNIIPSTKVVACSECHDRKLKCDNGTPCRQCTRHGLECVRKGLISELKLNTSPTDQSLPDHVLGGAPATDTSTYGNADGQHHWLDTNDYLHQEHHPPTLAKPAFVTTAPPTPPISLASDHEQSHKSPLRTLLHDIDESATYFLLEVFFTELHPYWPILHVSTFNITTVSDLLLGSILALGSWVSGREEHKTLVPAVYKEALAATEVVRALWILKNVTPSLHTLQGLVLLVVYSVYNINDEIGKACRGIAILTQSCRCIGIFNGSHSLPERLQDDAFTFWLAKEQLHRLAYAVFRLDTYLAVLLHIPPTVRYQELYIPFLASPFVWEAINGDNLENRLQQESQLQIEPSKATLFSSFHREFIYSPNPFASSTTPLPINHHLTLCALQAPIWEASAFSTDMDLSLLSNPNSPVRTARTHLERWHRRFGAADPNIIHPFDIPDVIEPLSQTLFHISKITMHAPLSLLRIHSAAPSGKHREVDTEKVAAKLGIWRASPCPRMAISSCAEICQLLSRDALCFASAGIHGSRRDKLDPLATPALLMAAIVACSYAAGVGQIDGGGCPSCTPGPEHEQGGCVDVFARKCPKSQQRVKDWEESGIGWPTWGATGIILCRCGLDKLGEWFLQDWLLGRDVVAKREFVAFMAGLKRSFE
ncbi:fungal-specific transcription factor domain-containing protein [Triangularia setosa]|uniref:Fungal-specific transcription factor domain-containing protein n=1 Tax=Triangularia setosa TaxID=2587417 RepID=A0AAN6W6G1_9PEZI|nr:fungal-specific transcription factor domain-containing protein [Podospora setosa]